MEQSPFWEADQSLQLVKKFPAFYGSRKFFTVLTSARHSSQSWANSIQSPRPPPTFWISILILSYHLRLGLRNGLFPSGFPPNTLCTPLSSPIRATCPSLLFLLDLTTRKIMGKEYRSFSYLLCNFLHSPVTSSLLNILLPRTNICDFQLKRLWSSHWLYWWKKIKGFCGSSVMY
jgi:hypothetical protein